MRLRLTASSAVKDGFAFIASIYISTLNTNQKTVYWLPTVILLAKISPVVEEVVSVTTTSW